MSIFPKVTIGKLLDDGVLLAVQDGNHGEIHPTTADYVDVGIPFVMASDLNGNQLDLARCKFITEARASGLRKGFAKTGDVLLTHKGSLGLTDVVGPFVGPFVMLTPQVTYYRPDGDRIESYFLKYVFQSPFFQGQMFAHSRDGTRPYIGITAQRELEVLLPDFDVQCRVATVLRAYDDLIATNQRRIALLEDAARRLYREWFVHLRFPGHESVPVKDRVPEGWRPSSFGENVSIRKGKNLTKSSVIAGEIPVVAAGLEPMCYHNIANAAGPVVTISASGANAGYVKLHHKDIWASDCSYISNDVTDSLYFVYCALKDRQEEILFMQKGAAQPHVYPKDIQAMEILWPDEKLVLAFQSRVLPLFAQCATLLQQNQKLAQARDLLLPKLMSGQLDVSGIALPDEVAA